MCRGIIRKAVSLMLALSCHVTPDYGMAVEKPPEPNDGYLTVRQSLLAMYAMGDFRGPAAVREQFPFDRINPDVREYARFYLERDNTLETNICGAVCLLGFIGNQDDISFVGQYVDENLARTLDSRVRFSRNLALAVGRFAGMMAKRGINGAELFLKKYAQVSSWIAPGKEVTPESVSDARDLYGDFIVGAYQYSKAPFLLPLLEEESRGPRPYLRESEIDTLKNMDTDLYTKLMNHKVLPEENLNKSIAKWLERYGPGPDMLLAKQTYAQWREAREKEKAAAKAEKKPAESFESIDMSETVEGMYVKAIARHATGAFEKVSRTVLDRNAKDAPIKKEVLQDIQRAGLKSYDDFQVTVDVEARVDGFSAATTRDERNTTKPAVIREKKAAAVTFRIQGTADILKKHAREAVPNASVSPTTGDVMIRMQRTGDTWYWASPSGPRVGAVADVVEDEYLIESVRAAMSTYAQISRALVDGDYDRLTIPVIDNGELIPLEKRKKDNEQMAKALDVEKKVLQELMIANLDAYGDHRIEVRWEATLGHGETDAEMGVMPLTVKGYETADVRFTIRNAAEAYRKHAPERSGYDSLDGAGNLRVWMKRINGKWYWSPFGW